MRHVSSFFLRAAQPPSYWGHANNLPMKVGECSTMCTDTHPYIPADRTAQVIVKFQGPGGYAQQGFHFIKDTEWSNSDLGDLGSSMDTWVHSHLLPLMSGQVSYTGIQVTDLSDVSGGQFESFCTTGCTGGESGNVLPSNVTLAIKKITNLRGRSFRGRNYFYGLAEDQVSGDTVNSSVVTAIADAYGLLVGPDAMLTGATWAVVSYCNGKTWRTSAVVSSIIGVSVDDTIDSQRRRLKGRGI